MNRALATYIQTHRVHALWDEPLSRHSTWRIGGPADVVALPGSLDALRDLLGLAVEHEIPWIVIGRGSNLLFSDTGFRGMVIKLDRPFSKVLIEGTCVTAQSGVFMPRLARKTGKAGLTGLEHTVGIPGNLGGLTAINGGSLRQGIGDVVRSVTVVTASGDVRTMFPRDCDFSYRHSNLLHSGCVVAEAVLELQRDDPRKILGRMLEILRERRAKFPLTQPNCGSVFTSDPALYHTLGPPGKIIEDLGLKGLTCGGIMVSHSHANFMVNLGHAKAEDVLALVSKVQQAIYERHQVRIKSEVMYVHPYGRIEPVSAVEPVRL